MDQILNQVTPWLCVTESYIHNLEENLETLKKTMENLKARRNDLLRKVEREESKGLRRLEQIQVWLTKVETIERQVDDLLRIATIEIDRLCLSGFCSTSLRGTYSYGKRVVVNLKEVENLYSTGVFNEIAEAAQVSEVVERPIPPTIVGQETLLETAWNRLMEDGVGLLGLCGMGGAGKTTLLTQINNKFFRREVAFDVVIWVVVSKDLHIQKIQENIAKTLGLASEDWNDKDEDQKACDILRVLKKKKFVLLLDDIWAEVELAKIGVPPPNRENGSKVVFTTRSQEVCRRMGDDVEMEVPCLAPHDAWDLFRKKVEIKDLFDGYVVHMHDVVREMGLWIASDCGKREVHFVMRAGAGLYEIPKVKDWNAVRRMSLMSNKIYRITDSLECFELTTLFLQWKKFVSISGEFFRSMPKLVVLDLSHNRNLLELPEEISKLVSLKYLNASNTDIGFLPVGLQELKNLIHLDLEFTDELWRTDGISKLLNLRVVKLYMSRSGNSNTVEELLVLKHLEIITINFSSDSGLDPFLSSTKLMCCTQTLAISFHACMEKVRVLQNLTNASFRSLSQIYICFYKFKDLTWLMFAPNLIELIVSEGDELEDILNKEKACVCEESGFVPFQKLEIMLLEDLPELKSIYWRPLPFQCLTKLRVERCPKLRKLPLDSKSGVGDEKGLVIECPEKKWIDGVEWEDEATKARFLPSSIEAYLTLCQVEQMMSSIADHLFSEY